MAVAAPGSGSSTDAAASGASEFYSSGSGTTTDNSGAVSEGPGASAVAAVTSGLLEAQAEMYGDGPVTCPPLLGVEEASQRAAAAHVEPFLEPWGKVRGWALCWDAGRRLRQCL